MRDGIKLPTLVHRANSDGRRVPAVLVRTAQDPREVFDEIGIYLGATTGLVVQGTRSRLKNQESSYLFRHERQDTVDTVEWLDEQSWYDGRLIICGQAEGAISAYLATAEKIPGLAGVIAAHGTMNAYSDLFFKGGVRRNTLVGQLIGGMDRSPHDDELGKYPPKDNFWKPIKVSDRLPNSNLGSIHYVGWYDPLKQGGIDAYLRFSEQTAHNTRMHQRLIIGPWSRLSAKQHSYLGPSYGENPPPQTNNAWALLDELIPVDTLRRTGTSLSQTPKIQYYVMGSDDNANATWNEWRVADQWPIPAARVRLYLQDDGTLRETCPPATADTSRYLFDPTTPAPTQCSAAGPLVEPLCNYRSVDERPDVLSFDTDKLQAPMEVTGRVAASLAVDIDQEDADLIVRVNDVYPDGRSMAFAEGVLRLSHREEITTHKKMVPGQLTRVSVDLQSVSYVLNQGHRLRVSVTSSNWPRFSVNHNNGLPYPYSEQHPTNQVQVRVHHRLDAQSYIELPMPQRNPQTIVNCSQD